MTSLILFSVLTNFLLKIHASVSSLLIVFWYLVEVSFSCLSCRRLSLKVYTDPPLNYVSYLFFSNCGNFVSKSIKNLYSQKRLNAFGHTCWKLNKKLSADYPLLHYASKILSYLHI